MLRDPPFCSVPCYECVTLPSLGTVITPSSSSWPPGLSDVLSLHSAEVARVLGLDSEDLVMGCTEVLGKDLTLHQAQGELLQGDAPESFLEVGWAPLECCLSFLLIHIPSPS